MGDLIGGKSLFLRVNYFTFCNSGFQINSGLPRAWLSLLMSAQERIAAKPLSNSHVGQIQYCHNHCDLSESFDSHMLLYKVSFNHSAAALSFRYH